MAEVVSVVIMKMNIMNLMLIAVNLKKVILKLVIGLVRRMLMRQKKCNKKFMKQRKN
ncbi:hypothetical protein LINPERPRIM_LOCUS39211 [Linum perenne]